MINILGFSGIIVGTIIFVAGILGLFKIGRGIGATLSATGFGNPKLWAIILIVAGIVIAGGFGGITGGFSQAWASIAGSAATASLTGSSTTVPAQGVAVQLSNIQVAAPTLSTGAGAGNSSMIADTADLTHYSIILNNATNTGGLSVNGTISVQRIGDVSQSAVIQCQFVGGKFGSQTSTTDSNTYFMVATSASKSKVAGFPWQQTAYINDGAIATTASTQETSPIVFTGGNAAAPTTTKTIGYYFTLPSATVLNYLNNQNSVDNKIDCDLNGDGSYDTTVARLTITKAGV